LHDLRHGAAGIAAAAGVQLIRLSLEGAAQA
jgi:hypothetical protein